MTARRISLIIAIAAATAALLLSIGYLVSGGEAGRGSLAGGTPAIGGPFELVNHEGRTVTDADFRGTYMLVYFGYTYCPDVCPTELQAMSEAMDALGAEAEQVQPVFITIDPERDTVEVMADYRQHFHPRLAALTGSPEQVAAAAKAYRVYYAKAPNADGGAYLMDHSSFVFLIGPDGEYVRHFSPGTPPDKMAEEIRAVL